MSFWGRPPPPPPPLPPVLAPEPVDKQREGQYLDRVLRESRSVLDADLGGFEQLTTREGWSVHSKPVEGTKLTMVRLEAEVPMQPDTLFQLLTSMDGKRIIDPFPRERHSELVQPLCLPKGDAKVVYSEMPRFAGMLRPREYVTCDAVAPAERLFVCKSCHVRDGPLAGVQRGKVRANLLFAMRMKELPGRRGSRLQMINWVDLGANTVPVPLANFITERWYFQALMRRLDRFTAKHRLGPDTPPAALSELLHKPGK